MYETLDLRRDERGVQYVTLNRPDKRNALSAQMIDDLTDMARTVPEGTRAVVLAGAGKVFCAGGDLEWMRDQIAADPATRMVEARKLADMLGALNVMPAPLIGQVHGAAMGGGLGLCCVCDVVVAERGCKFGFTETRLGLIPATIGPYALARMGEGMARRVFMSARIFEPAEAIELGIVSWMLPSLEDLDAAVEAEVAPYLQVAPGAVSRAKALARKLGPAIDEATVEASIAALAEAWDSEEAAHGIAAFLEKTAPRWQT